MEKRNPVLDNTDLNGDLGDIQLPDWYPVVHSGQPRALNNLSKILRFAEFMSGKKYGLT